MSVCKDSGRGEYTRQVFFLEIRFQGKTAALHLIRAASTYMLTWEFFLFLFLFYKTQ